MSMLFRKSDTYKKKLMRIGAALRRFSNVSGFEHNFNSLAVEVDALEELSLSAFSLMKAIKQELSEAARKTAETQGQACKIIRPFAVDDDTEDR